MIVATRLFPFGALALLVLLPLLVNAAPDARMQVDVTAEEQGVEVNWLHANIRKAADMALPQLWARIIPQHAIDLIPPHVKAIRFLQKAVPNTQGVSILFNEKRVLRYLQQHNIPYYAEQSAGQTSDQTSDQTVARTLNPTASQTARQTAVGPQMSRSSSVAARTAGSPLLPPQTGQQFAGGPGGLLPSVHTPLLTGLLTLQRQASLPEQALFEEDLARDPHVLSLTLRQVSRNEQQYRLQMKSPNDQWLQAWFQRRGMILTASVDGWVVQQQAAR